MVAFVKVSHDECWHSPDILPILNLLEIHWRGKWCDKEQVNFSSRGPGNSKSFPSLLLNTGASVTDFFFFFFFYLNTLLYNPWLLISGRITKRWGEFHWPWVKIWVCLLILTISLSNQSWFEQQDTASHPAWQSSMWNKLKMIQSWVYLRTKCSSIYMV